MNVCINCKKELVGDEVEVCDYCKSKPKQYLTMKAGFQTIDNKLFFVIGSENEGEKYLIREKLLSSYDAVVKGLIGKSSYLHFCFLEDVQKVKDYYAKDKKLEEGE